MSELAMILVAVGLVIGGQLLLKAGMLRVGAIDRSRVREPLALLASIAKTPAVVAGLAVYGVSAMAWLVVLSRSDLSYAYPFLSIAYAGVTAAATVVFRERFSPIQWSGLVFVMVGVVIVAMSGGQM